MSEPWKDENSRRWEEWRINQEAAQRAHDLHHRDMADMFQSVVSFGLEAIRTSALINGGASVAAIAFLGAVFEADPGLARLLASAMLLFVSGVIAAGAASGFGYLAQFCYERETWSTTLSFEHPYVHPQPPGKKWRRTGGVFHAFCIVGVLASYGCLIWGAYRIYLAVIG